MMINCVKTFTALSSLGIAVLCNAGEIPAKAIQIGAEKPPILNPGSEKILGDFRNSIADMAEKVIPVVVSIQVESAVQAPMETVNPFEFFFGPGLGQQYPNPGGNLQQQPKQQGLGSGVIVSKDGYILTNNHVIENAENISVTLSDKREYKAKVIGADPQTDVAVIKLEQVPKDLPVAYLGKSESLRVGEWIVAIGNPYGLSRTVTTGIVSAKGVHNRGISSYESFIQVDAAINPGNSGGGLFNLAGELVGINTAILSRSGGFQGIGFAIPIDLARGILNDLVRYGKVTRGWIGVSIQDMDPKLAKAMKLDSLQGAVVAEVFANSPAQKAGMQIGDVITKVNGVATPDANALRTAVAMIKPGEKTVFNVLREGKDITLAVQVSSRDDGAEADELSGSSGSKDLGIDVIALTDNLREKNGMGAQETGVVVRSVANGGIAGRAGLMPNDIILQINRNPVKGVSSFREILRQLVNAKSLIFLIKRDRARFFVVVER